MSETPTRHGALDGLPALQHPGVTVAPVLPGGVLNLRGRIGEAGFRDGVAEALGAAPPAAPNTVARGRGVTLLWLGPDEWLAVADPELTPSVEELMARLQGMHAAVTDLGDGQTWIELAGHQARDLLARGCPLDLHPQSFPAGRCAQTRLAQASVLLYALDSGRLWLQVRRSMARYLWSWLAASLDRLEVVEADAEPAAALQARSAP
ncbi:sarcosine oxidase subunit gamma [Spiribacter halobius]|nr:sarcosine oxidase subunit gamma family protein [Spiribacter halobius]UEX79056.1 hypothetical protein LMH63_05280 [Spiribacter halobius]